MLSASLLVGGRGESALTWFGHPKVLADLFTPNHSLFTIRRTLSSSIVRRGIIVIIGRFGFGLGRFSTLGFGFFPFTLFCQFRITLSGL